MRPRLQHVSPRLGAPLRDWTRAADWWEDKLVPTLSVFYLTAALRGVSVAALAPDLALLLAALIPGAVYVSVLNDFSDQEEDRAAGKTNRWARMPRAIGVLLLGTTIGAGVAFAVLWRHDPACLLPYLGAWLAFSCYSLPPIRLKVRGGLGVVADASGAHLFPAVLATALAFRHVPEAPDVPWMAAVAVWSFAYGLRGILAHQLLDERADAAGGVWTFVRRHGARAAIRIGNGLVLPAELAALAALLWHGQQLAAVAALIAYLGIVVVRWRLIDMPVTIVAPRPRSQLFLQDYYGVFLPIAVLLGSALRHPADALVLGLHLLLFPRRAAWLCRDLWAGEADAYRPGGRRSPARWFAERRRALGSG